MQSSTQAEVPKSIKVLHMCSEKGWRGGEQQIAYLIEELSKYGVESIVALKRDSALERHCNSRSIKTIFLPFYNSIDMHSAWKLKKKCSQEGIDLIHMHTSKSHGIGVLAAWLGNKTPLILSRRVDFEPKANFLTRWKYNHPNIRRILCVSNKIKEIMQRYVKDKTKCMTVYSGIDLNKFSKPPSTNILREEFKIPKDTVIIGNTAALADHKDYYTFIDTIEVLSRGEQYVHAFIVGEGPMERELKDYVLRKGLQHVITFTGFRKNITDILQCFDIFLMSSKEEGLGTSILDSFVAHVPMVATNAGGIPEVVRHEQTGLVANIGDSKMLASHITRIIKDPALRTRLVENAFNLVQDFSKTVTARKTFDEYKSYIHSRN